MATTIIMPKLGNTVESSVILSWKVKPGDAVKADTVLCEIETDKATMDVPAGIEGTVLALLRKEGDDVPVLEPIAIIGAPGEAIDQPAPQKKSPESESAAKPGQSGQSAQPDQFSFAENPASNAETAPAEKHASPRARQAMSRLDVDIEAIAQGSGPQGRIIERDVIALSSAEPKNAEGIAPQATPPVAPEARPATAAQPSAQPAARPLAQPTGQSAFAGQSSTQTTQEYETIPLVGIRKRIANRMRESIQTTAQYTEHSSADAERLLDLRARLKAQKNPELSGITIGDLVLAAVIKVLPEFPEFNAHLEEGTLKLYKPIHLGVAVDTPKGLMVPVVRNAQTLSLSALSKEVKRLAHACQNGTIDPDSLSGSTFTVTNLGAYGIEQFTPVINAPETAILGVCTIRPALIQKEKGIETRMRIGLSLTADHQVIDGAYAARFLARLAEVITDIDFQFISL